MATSLSTTKLEGAVEALREAAELAHNELGFYGPGVSAFLLGLVDRKQQQLDHEYAKLRRCWSPISQAGVPEEELRAQEEAGGNQ